MVGSLGWKPLVTWTGLALLMTVFAGCAAPPAGGGDGDGDLRLKLGTMMPLTGALSNLGADMQAGAKLAIDEINDADVGLRIEAFHEDDKTTDTAAAPNTFNLLVSKGVTAIAGPCCSGVTGAILDAAKENEVVIASPSATSPTLTIGRDNGGYFWRVPPNDGIQGRVLSDLVKANNVTTVSILLINNPYGNGMSDVFKAKFESGTPPGVVLKVEKYAEEGSPNFSSHVTSVCSAPKPQGIVIIGYTKEGGAIIREMQSQGCLANLKLFGSEGVYSADDALAKEAGKDAQGKYLNVGMKGTTPESNLTAWNIKFKAKYGRDPNLYSAESYDAVMYLALAAIKAGSTEGKAISMNLLSVANGGTKVDDFEDAAEMLHDGKDIDWVGQSHDFDYDSRHEPNTGLYSWWEVAEDGHTKIIARGKSA